MKVKTTSEFPKFTEYWELLKKEETCQCTKCKRRTKHWAKVLFVDADKSNSQERPMCPKCFYRWVVSLGEKSGKKVDFDY